jgi:hypothetical protein
VGAVRKSLPRFRREGEAPRVALTDDDVDILRRVFSRRFIRADDLYRLYPERSADKLSRRLTLLYRSSNLDRPIAQVDRFRGGGSQPLVYGLDRAGARYLSETFGLSMGSGDFKTRNRRYTRENLDHTLAVSTYLTDLELACRARDDVDLISWEEILADAPEATRRLPAPGKWPVPMSLNSVSDQVHLAPDAIFGLRRRNPDGETRRAFFFLEIDRGTMTIAPAKAVRDSDAFLFRATILRKLLAYAESAQRGAHQRHLGIPAARVLFLTTSAQRAAGMQEAAQRHVLEPKLAPAGLFLFGLSEGGEPLVAQLADSAGVEHQLCG